MSDLRPEDLRDPALARAWGWLTDKQQSVLILRLGLKDDYRKLSFGEIADVMGVSPQSARRLYERAMCELRSPRGLNCQETP